MEITQKIVALKLPEKYRFTGGVMGNGMTLGLTNGTNNYGLTIGAVNATTWAGSASTSTYGKDAGTTPGALPANIGSLGITTDPTKSGITLEKEPWLVFIAY